MTRLPGENLYTYLLRTFHEDDSASKIKWCKEHHKVCEDCIDKSCKIPEEVQPNQSGHGG
jgi:hypothetical protein